MKYIYHNEHIPHEARQELNDKILYLVEQDLADQSGITREDIYNAYTGDGGLQRPPKIPCKRQTVTV